MARIVVLSDIHLPSPSVCRRPSRAGSADNRAHNRRRGGSITYTYTSSTPAPESSTWAMLVAGYGALALRLATGGKAKVRTQAQRVLEGAGRRPTWR
jgi:hypothetical protein